MHSEVTSMTPNLTTDCDGDCDYRIVFSNSSINAQWITSMTPNLTTDCDGVCDYRIVFSNPKNAQ